MNKKISKGDSPVDGYFERYPKKGKKELPEVFTKIKNHDSSRKRFRRALGLF